MPSCRVYKQIKGFEAWVKYNSPGSNIDVLRKVYQVAASCRHLAHTIVPPHNRKAQYRVMLTGYGPQASPSTVQVLIICYMMSYQSQLLQQTGTLLVSWQHASIHVQIIMSNHNVIMYKHSALHWLNESLHAGCSAFQPALL